MSNYLRGLSALFWSEKVWIPPNITWQLYEDNNYRHFNDIHYSVITALLLIGIRLTLERFIYTPFGVYLGLKPTQNKNPPNNVILEKAFIVSKGKITNKQIEGLAKQLDWSPRQIQRWIGLKSAQNRPNVLSKFTESAWRCNFYFVLFVYGCYVLWDKPWMWDSNYFFMNYPHHVVSNGEWFYFNIEYGFYLGLLFSQFFDVKRKDFWMMFSHHIITLCIMCFLWACNLVRMTTFVLLIHDFADISLELAKMMNYAKKQLIANGIFVFFIISWVFTRTGLFPYRVLYYLLFDELSVMPFGAYYIFNGLFLFLQTLHIVWTWFIVRTIIAIKNKEYKDMRSDDEESDEELLNDSLNEVFNDNKT